MSSHGGLLLVQHGTDITGGPRPYTPLSTAGRFKTSRDATLERLSPREPF